MRKLTKLEVLSTLKYFDSALGYYPPPDDFTVRDVVENLLEALNELEKAGGVMTDKTDKVDPEYRAAFTRGEKKEKELWEAEVALCLDEYSEDVLPSPTLPERVLGKNVMLANKLSLDKFSADTARQVLWSLLRRVAERRATAEEET